MEFRNVTETAAAAITLSKNNSVNKGPADKGNQPLAFRGIGDPTVLTLMTVFRFSMKCIPGYSFAP